MPSHIIYNSFLLQLSALQLFLLLLLCIYQIIRNMTEVEEMINRACIFLSCSEKVKIQRLPKNTVNPPVCSASNC